MESALISILSFVDPVYQSAIATIMLRNKIPKKTKRHPTIVISFSFFLVISFLCICELAGIGLV